MDQEIMSDQAQRLELLYEFHSTRPCESEKRAELLNKMLGKIGEGCYIEPPFRANWAGKHLHLAYPIGNDTYRTSLQDEEIKDFRLGRRSGMSATATRER